MLVVAFFRVVGGADAAEVQRCALVHGWTRVNSGVWCPGGRAGWREGDERVHTE